MPRKIIFWLFMLFSLGASAQVPVSSKVFNTADNTPVPYASVFLSNTTIGAQTRDDGSFTLGNVKPGKYEMIITVIGFENYRQKIDVGNDLVKLADIHISPKTNALKEVVIRSKNNRKKYFDWFYETFREQFLGKTDFAADCKILNPQVLDIDYDEGSNTISATADEPLQIENDALGYKIQYLLNDFKYIKVGPGGEEISFSGNVLFTGMQGTAQQESRWRKRRQEAYEGSQLHFLRSALVNRLNEDGFRAWRFVTYRNPEKPADSVIAAKIKRYRQLKTEQGKRYNDSLSYWEKKAALPGTFTKLIDKPANVKDMIRSTDQDGVFVLDGDSSRLYVTFSKRHSFPVPHALDDLDKPINTESTLVRFNSPDVFFGTDGGVINPNSLSYRGIWGRGRVAWLLPNDYAQPQAEVVIGDTLLTHITNQLKQYGVSYNDERVYLHLDKPNYGFGDTVWYKAYTVIGQRHQPSVLSSVLYVELISPADSLISRQSIPLISGMGWSDIPLPFNLKPGSYRLRAYTRWMRNFGPGAYDEQKIIIGGIAPPAAKAPGKYDVQFFPEGGALVEGVRSRVAVKAIGSNGRGKDISGTIEDNAGNLVAEFSTQHLGMGVFAMVPEKGKTYKARINIAGETAFTVDMPKVEPAGYTLSVNNNGEDSLYVKIATNEKTLTVDKDKTFYIVAQSNGKVYYTTQGKLEGTVYTASLSKDRFPEGIAQFTLFSQNGAPVAERIAFIENKDYEIDLSINANEQTYSTRNKVSLNIAAEDGDDKPVTGSFSVSVINETKVSPDENEESTILNNLLLTSELKGYIEQPNYYFTSESDKTRSELDLLMLTQGYRRYDWKQILTIPTNTTGTTASTTPTTFPPESAQELSGIITEPGGKPLPNSKITLAATKQGIFRDTTADENGRFTFTGLNITDTATVVIKARKANNGSNVKIAPDEPAYPKITPDEYPGALMSTDTVKAKAQYTDYRQKQKDYKVQAGRLLKTVTINGVRKPVQPKLEFSSNMNGPGHADQVLMWDQLGDGCALLSDCLYGKLTGVIISPPVPGVDPKRKAYLQRAQNRLNAAHPMAVIIDGMIMDGSHLDDISPNQIYSIEVLRSGGLLALYGSNAFGGALIITLKHGGEGTAYLTQMRPDGITTMRFQGFYKAKAFYTPKYDSPKKDNDAEDLRSTIYWNPDILTDKDGKASIEFYNNDSKGTYRMVVEGIDDEGRLGRAVYRYEVK